MGAEQETFARNIACWGEAKQQVLAQSAVLVAGLGGLGCIVAEILVRAGLGRVVLLDYKTIDAPDLNRQALYTLDDLGQPKIEVAARKLAVLNELTQVVTLPLKIEDNAATRQALADTMGTVEGVADCLDNYVSRFALERMLHQEHFLVHGGVQADYGQATTIVPAQTAGLQDLYCDVSDAAGPVAVCPQIVYCLGSLMAHEVLKNLWGTPELLNTLLIVELSDFSFTKLALSPLAS
jgi:molybdopterin-synthase adenylyltransferase